MRSQIIPMLLQASFPIAVPAGITTGIVKVNEFPGAMLAVSEIFALLGEKLLLQVFAGRLQAGAVVGQPVLWLEVPEYCTVAPGMLSVPDGNSWNWLFLGEQVMIV
jgi:hypothetical protein